MTQDAGKPISGRQRFLDLVARVAARGGRRSEQTERILLLVAAIIFLVAAAFAWRGLPDIEQDVRLGRIGLVAALAVLALVINAWEFGLSALVLGRPVRFGVALRVSAMSSAANVLPIPGSVVIRSRALRQDGHRLRSAVVVTTAIGVAWVSSAALLAAALAVAAGVGLAWIMGAAGALGWCGAIFMLRLSVPGLRIVHVWQLALIELASVGASGLRLYAVADTLGFGVNLTEAVTINLGGILSNVAGILPGGLGVRELASGLFGALVGVPASIGVLMAAIDRIVFYVVLAVVAGLLVWLRVGAVPEES